MGGKILNRWCLCVARKFYEKDHGNLRQGEKYRRAKPLYFHFHFQMILEVFL